MHHMSCHSVHWKTKVLLKIFKSQHTLRKLSSSKRQPLKTLHLSNSNFWKCVSCITFKDKRSSSNPSFFFSSSFGNFKVKDFFHNLDKGHFIPKRCSSVETVLICASLFSPSNHGEDGRSWRWKQSTPTGSTDERASDWSWSAAGLGGHTVRHSEKQTGSRNEKASNWSWSAAGQGGHTVWHSKEPCRWLHS